MRVFRSIIDITTPTGKVVRIDDQNVNYEKIEEEEGIPNGDLHKILISASVSRNRKASETGVINGYKWKIIESGWDTLFLGGSSEPANIF